MKIINKEKTHFMQKASNSLLYVKYDTIENVHLLINTILDNGHKKMLNERASQPSEKELI